MKLRAYRLTVADVARASDRKTCKCRADRSRSDPAEYTLRTMGRVGNMKEMNAIAVANREGRTITIGDLGQAEDSTEELKSASLYNDTPACC